MFNSALVGVDGRAGGRDGIRPRLTPDKPRWHAHARAHTPRPSAPLAHDVPRTDPRGARGRPGAPCSKSERDSAGVQAQLR